MTVNIPLLLLGPLLLRSPQQWMRLGVTIGPRHWRPLMVFTRNAAHAVGADA